MQNVKPETNVETRKIPENNAACELDVDFMEMSVPLEEIETDGYKIGVNCHPVRQHDVNELKATFTGCLEKPIVVYSTKDGNYHVVQKQDLVVAVRQLINDGKIEPIKEITCDIIARKSTLKILDAKSPEDRFLCLKYSYSVADTGGKNCTSDASYMV